MGRDVGSDRYPHILIAFCCRDYMSMSVFLLYHPRLAPAASAPSLISQSRDTSAITENDSIIQKHNSEFLKVTSGIERSQATTCAHNFIPRTTKQRRQSSLSPNNASHPLPPLDLRSSISTSLRLHRRLLRGLPASHPPPPRLHPAHKSKLEPE